MAGRKGAPADGQLTPRTLRRWMASRRYWDRMAALISLFGLTGWLEGEFPQSVMLVGPPGRGKSKLLMRFRHTPFLSTESDLTVRQLYPLLRSAHRGTLTHLVAPEIQKFFQRKGAVADNCISLLSIAMSEGVGRVSVGPRMEDFHGAQLGVLGAITGRTMRRRGSYLDELGFLDRTSVIPWELADGEIRQVMDRITRGNRADIQPVVLPFPRERVKVRLPVEVGKRIKSYVWGLWRGDSLRPLERLRGLVMALALFEGRTKVTLVDWKRIEAYDDIWRTTLEVEGTN